MSTPDLFTEAAELEGPDVVARATKRGALIEQRGPVWVAIARKRGRPLPLVEFHAETQAAAASMFCAYFHIHH